MEKANGAIWRKFGFVKLEKMETLSDTWESTNWEGLCGTPWQVVALELELTKKVS